MPRDWVGSVFHIGARGDDAGDTFAANWKEFGTERWRRTKGFATKSEANDFLAKKRKEYRERRAGTFDERAEQHRKPIAEHVADFHEHILANRKRRGEKRHNRHADQSKTRLTLAFAGMKVKTVLDIQPSKVDRYLAKLLDVEGFTVKTRNDYAATLKQFTKWAAADDRIEKDPLGNVRFVENVKGPARKQTHSWQVVRDIAAACIQRQVQNTRGIDHEQRIEHGRRRALAVVTVFLTGLRNGELSAMSWGWIDFSDRFIEVPAAVTKTARLEYIPLHDGLAELLQHERKRRARIAGKPIADSELVIGKLSTHLSDRLRSDLEFIKMPAVDAGGRTFSLYAMRTSLGTELTELGVLDGVVSHLLRHKPPDVTRKHYVQRSLKALLAAINAIPAEAAYVPGLMEEPREGEAAKESAASRIS